MAIADTWTPSRRMRAAAASERERVERELSRLTARETELSAELAALHSTRDELEHQLRVLDHFTDGDDETRTPGRADRRLRVVPQSAGATEGTTILRGAQIREVAVRILAANNAPEAPVHYRDWFELVTAQGFSPGGKDPLVTFLTQIGRSPVVGRTTTAGMYVLDLEFLARARERLVDLRAQLAEVEQHASDVTVEQLATARERRAQLTAELQETERQLEEALRSLGEAEA